MQPQQQRRVVGTDVQSGRRARAVREHGLVVVEGVHVVAGGDSCMTMAYVLVRLWCVDLRNTFKLRPLYAIFCVDSGHCGEVH